jgi:hypothetical protein
MSKARSKGTAIDITGLVLWSDQGNRYLLIAMNYFSKFPEAYAIPVKRLR